LRPANKKRRGNNSAAPIAAARLGLISESAAVAFQYIWLAVAPRALYQISEFPNFT
jgi:hypothetical protein